MKIKDTALAKIEVSIIPNPALRLCSLGENEYAIPVSSPGEPNSNWKSLQRLTFLLFAIALHMADIVGRYMILLNERIVRAFHCFTLGIDFLLSQKAITDTDHNASQKMNWEVHTASTPFQRDRTKTHYIFGELENLCSSI